MGYCSYLGFQSKRFECIKEHHKTVENGVKTTVCVETQPAQEETLNAMLNWLNSENGQVGIYDATNSTNKTRQWVKDYLEKNLKNNPVNLLSLSVLFVETVCEKPELIKQNMRGTCSIIPGFQDTKDVFNEDLAEKFIDHLKVYDRDYETPECR